MNCGERLRLARKGKPMAEVANDLGISLAALSMYESEERSPRDELKVRIAKYYNTTVGRLFFGE